jgi:peptidoglycan hydrolase CwlO-like protein
MIKWAAIGVTGLGAVGYFLFGENAMNYVSTMATSVKDSVRGQIPIEFELKRAEGLIADIAPQIQQCKLEVARQEVQLEGLTDDIDRLERDVARGERKLKAGADLLASNGEATTYQLAGTTCSRERVEMDLERTFEAYKSNSELLTNKKALIERQTKAVAAARSKLDAVRAEEARLRDLIGQLKTQKAQIDAMAASSKSFTLDDSALGQAKKVLTEVKERLDVAQRMLADDLFFEKGVSTESGPPRDIVKEIRMHFASNASTTALGVSEATQVIR